MWYPRPILAGIVGSLVLLAGLFSTQPANAVVPGNDNLESATNAVVPPNYSNTIADNTDATRQSGEPQCNFVTDTVWYKHTPASNTTLSADSFGSNFDTVLVVFTGPSSSPTFGALTLVACNDDSGGTQSQVVFAASAGTTYYFQVGGVAGSTGSLTFHLAVSGVASPSNDNYLGAVNASPLPYTNTRSTVGAALEPSEQRPPCGASSPQIGATVWYKHTPSTAGTLTASTAGSNFDTMVAAYTGSTLAILTLLGCDDDSGAGPTSILSLSATSGTAYYFQIGGWDNATGNLSFNLSFVPALDSDGDGWSDAAEGAIGTSPTLDCGLDAWPPDIDNSGYSDITDISALTSVFGQSVPPAPARYDIAPDPPDDIVDITDVSRVTSFFNTSCTP